MKWEKEKVVRMKYLKMFLDILFVLPCIRFLKISIEEGGITIKIYLGKSSSWNCFGYV